MAKMVLTSTGDLWVNLFIQEPYTSSGGTTPTASVLVGPSDFSGLTWWFKADQLSASYSQSQAVNVWPSFISSSYSASQTTVANQPYYTETHFPSGNPSVYFEKGNTDQMNMVNANFGITMSLSFVSFPQAVVDAAFLSYNPIGTLNNQVRVFNSNLATQPVMFYTNAGAVVVTANTFSSSVSSPRLANIVMNPGALKTIKIYEGHKVRGEYVNGVNRYHNFTQTNYNFMGKISDQPTNFLFTGSIAEFCAYSSSALTEDDLIDLYEQYWRPKYPDLVQLGTSASSAGVDPTTIDGHRFSFIANDTSSMQLTGSNNDKLYAWSSSYHDAGGPYTASQPTSANQPTHETNILNGNAGVYFFYDTTAGNGSFMHMEFTALTGSTVSGSEVFYVCRRVNVTTGATEYTITGAPTNWGGASVGASNHHTWVTYDYYDSHFSDTRFNWTQGRIGEQANRYLLNFAVNTGSYQVFFNGSGSYTNTGSFTPRWLQGITTGQPWMIGRGTRDNTGTYMFWGHICEIVHFSRKLTTQERTDVTNWLRTKYKIYDG